MGKTSCSDCGEQFSDSFAADMPRRPCPRCGSISRTSENFCADIMNLTDSLQYSQQFGHTGREVMGSQAKVDASEWSQIAEFDDQLKNVGAQRFEELIGEANFLKGESITLYRGTGIHESEATPPSLSRMGPIPETFPWRGGRYHREGERALYLAETEDGVRRELDAWCVKGTPWVIKSEIPLVGLKIADFSELPPDHFLTAVFALAEGCRVEGRGPDNYGFSQVVASLAKKTFDGMRVLGVRGEPGFHYRNVVIFHHLEEWPNWKHGQPYLLSTRH